MSSEVDRTAASSKERPPEDGGGGKMTKNVAEVKFGVDGKSKGTAVLTAENATASRQSGCCSGLNLFVLNISVMLLFHMIGGVYTSGIVRTLERRFGLRSSQTGFLFSCNDIIQTLLVVPVGYFGRRANKPRILSVTVMFTAVSMLLMASPHWLFHSWSSAAASSAKVRVGSGASTAFNGTAKAAAFCAATFSNATECDAPSPSAVEGSASGTEHPAYHMFVFAQLLSGIGSSGLHSLSLAYIDENAPRTKSAFYVGIVTSMYAFGPVGGFMLSAITLRLPENILSPTTERPEDPSFIGCWWLGYVICSVGIMLTSIPMFFFPKTFKQTPLNGKQSVATKPLMAAGAETGLKPPKRKRWHRLENIWTEIKEFPRGLMHLLQNKAYLTVLGSIITGAYLIVGVFINMVRYIEIHFFERAFVASSITALVSAFAGAIGGFSGGFLMSRMRLTPAGAAKLMIMCTAFFASGLFVITWLGCPQLELAGSIDPVHQTLSVMNECNHGCGCATDRKSYAPVCGSDNLTYFSACFAGCTDGANGTYTGCSCIGYKSKGILTTRSEANSTKDFPGTARRGLCVTRCKLIIPYAVIMFLISLIGSMARVPGTMVNFRIVDDDERSFALAINSFIINLLGFIPAPILFGRLIDSSCRMWQRTAAVSPTSTKCGGGIESVLASGGTGSCLLYDTAKFRQRTYGVAFIFQAIDVVLTVVLYKLIRNRNFSINGADEDDGEQRHQTNGNNNANEAQMQRYLERFAEAKETTL